MPAVAIAAYPKGASMNMEYYKTKHVPWVFGLWQPYAKSVKVMTPAADDESCPYEAVIEIGLDHRDDLAKAMAQLSPEDAKAIDDDLANYSQKKAAIWVMDVQPSST